ncbi:MAG: hypothetical protein HZB39_16470 [Planctomycetes bacterium]|nr:hypothetical protein [Planctomycetota bacterium]
MIPTDPMPSGEERSKQPGESRPSIPGWVLVIVMAGLAAALGWFIARAATR